MESGRTNMQGEKASSLLDFWEACRLQDWLCCWSPPPGSLSPQCWDGESLLPWAQVQIGSKASPPLQDPKSLRPGQESPAEGPSFRASYSYLQDISHVHEKNPLDGFPKPKRKRHFSARYSWKQAKGRFRQMLWEIQEKFKGEDCLPSQGGGELQAFLSALEFWVSVLDSRWSVEQEKLTRTPKVMTVQLLPGQVILAPAAFLGFTLFGKDVTLWETVSAVVKGKLSPLKAWLTHSQDNGRDWCGVGGDG